MISHHTKTKGDLGVLKAQVDLFQQGYLILLPQTEHAPFDLVAWKDGEFKTVQVKYRELDNGTVRVKFSTSWADKNGTHEKPIDKSLVDLMCIYCPDTDECYYVDPKKFNKSITLRIGSSGNGQTKGVNLASDYKII